MTFLFTCNFHVCLEFTVACFCCHFFVKLCSISLCLIVRFLLDSCGFGNLLVYLVVVGLIKYCCRVVCCLILQMGRNFSVKVKGHIKFTRVSNVCMYHGLHAVYSLLCIYNHQHFTLEVAR